ncbi:MAG: ATPase, T2SS/T4P/T4SS family [Microthrixaceae bacterium]
MKMGTIDERALAAALAYQFGIPLADLTQREARARAPSTRLPEELARKHTVIPLRIDENDRVFMAIADPLDTEAIDELTRQCRRIGLMMGTRTDIERLLDETYNVLHAGPGAHPGVRAGRRRGRCARGRGRRSRSTTTRRWCRSSTGSSPRACAAGRPTSTSSRARTYVRVRYRVDGAMTEAIQLPDAAWAPAIASRIKVMAELNIVERRRPQDGQFAVVVDGRPIDVRIVDGRPRCTARRSCCACSTRPSR